MGFGFLTPTLTLTRPSPSPSPEPEPEPERTRTRTRTGTLIRCVGVPRLEDQLAVEEGVRAGLRAQGPLKRVDRGLGLLQGCCMGRDGSENALLSGAEFIFRRSDRCEKVILYLSQYRPFFPRAPGYARGGQGAPRMRKEGKYVLLLAVAWPLRGQGPGRAVGKTTTSTKGVAVSF